MDSGFSYGDIIVIGAIAAFILLRYRAMLGETSERDQQPRVKPAPISDYERVIQLPIPRAAATPEKSEDLAGKYGSLAETFIAMRAIDREFSPEDFLTGARAAYEMVIEAFSKADRETLKMLLAEDIYKQFDTSLKELETTLLAINRADVAQAKLSGNTATITVDFRSEQVHLVRDKAGTIIEGNASSQELVEDTWVFTRSLTSSSPNWTIIET